MTKAQCILCWALVFLLWMASWACGTICMGRPAIPAEYFSVLVSLLAASKIIEIRGNKRLKHVRAREGEKRG